MRRGVKLPGKAASHGMESVFLRNGRYAVHVGLWLRQLLGCFGEESFKSRGSDIDEHADRLIRIIFESVDRAAGGVNAIAREHVDPGAVHIHSNPAVDENELFVFAFVVMRPRPAARRSDIEKSRELLAGLFAVEQHDYCVAKRMQRAPFGSSYKERNGWVSFDIVRTLRRSV
jgi:hypothetical protein